MASTSAVAIRAIDEPITRAICRARPALERALLDELDHVAQHLDVGLGEHPLARPRIGEAERPPEGPDLRRASTPERAATSSRSSDGVSVSTARSRASSSSVPSASARATSSAGTPSASTASRSDGPVDFGVGLAHENDAPRSGVDARHSSGHGRRQPAPAAPRPEARSVDQVRSSPGARSVTGGIGHPLPSAGLQLPQQGRALAVPPHGVGQLAVGGGRVVDLDALAPPLGGHQAHRASSGGAAEPVSRTSRCAPAAARPRRPPGRARGRARRVADPDRRLRATTRVGPITDRAQASPGSERSSVRPADAGLGQLRARPGAACRPG